MANFFPMVPVSPKVALLLEAVVSASSDFQARMGVLIVGLESFVCTPFPP